MVIPFEESGIRFVASGSVDNGDYDGSGGGDSGGDSQRRDMSHVQESIIVLQVC